MKKYFGQLLIVLVTVIGASGWFFSKNAILELPSVGFMGMRFTLGALIFLPFSYSGLLKMNRQQFWRSCAIGIVLALNLMLWVLGITFSNNFGEGAFLVSLSMLIAPLVSWLIFKHQPQSMFWLSMPIALGGLYLLATARSVTGELNFSLGSLFFLFSSLSAALYFVLNNQYAKHIATMPLITIQFFMVGAVCLGYSLLFEQWRSAISPNIWLWFLASTLIATNLRYFVQTLGQKHCDISTAAILMILEPIWTLILSVWLLDELLTWQKTLGCLLILTALLLYRLPNLVKK